MEGMQIIKVATGDYPVYPGHPLVIAREIIGIFDSPDLALAPCKTNGLNCPEAVADNRISGGGGEVGYACHLLKAARNGMPADEFIRRADEYWVSVSAGGHVNAVAPGLAQAAKLKAEFPIKLAEWLKH